MVVKRCLLLWCRRWNGRTTLRQIHHHSITISTYSCPVYPPTICSVYCNALPISNFNRYKPLHDNDISGVGRRPSRSSVFGNVVYTPFFAKSIVSSPHTLHQSRCNHSSKQRGSRNQVYLEFEKCKSIEEMTQMAYDHKDMISSRQMATFWTLVSKFVQRRGRPTQKYEHMQMLEIFQR